MLEQRLELANAIAYPRLGISHLSWRCVGAANASAVHATMVAERNAI